MKGTKPRPIRYKITNSGCWEITSHRAKIRGYPIFKINGSQILIHRHMWEKTYGSIPSGIFVCHSCDNPACVNPEHSFLGTQKDNMRDMIKKGRGNCGGCGKGEKHWRAKITEENVREIRRLYKRSSYHQSDALVLAARFNVTKGTILDIIDGRSWRSLV